MSELNISSKNEKCEMFCDKDLFLFFLYLIVVTMTVVFDSINLYIVIGYTHIFATAVSF